MLKKDLSFIIFILMAILIFVPQAIASQTGTEEYYITPYRPHMDLKYLLPWASEDEMGSKTGFVMKVADRLGYQEAFLKTLYSPDARKLDYTFSYENNFLKQSMSFEVFDTVHSNYYQGINFGQRKKGQAFSITFPVTRRKYCSLKLLNQKIFNRNLVPGLLDQGDERALELKAGYVRELHTGISNIDYLGTGVEFKAKKSGLFSKNDFNFTEFFVKGSHYKNFHSKNSFIGGHFQAGSINTESNFRYPTFYFLGGDNNLRGYDFDSFYGNKSYYLSMEYIRNHKFSKPLMEYPFYIDSASFILMADIGDAWEDGVSSDAKSDVGFEVRTVLYFFQKVPLSLSMGIAMPFEDNYGLRTYFSTKGLF